MSRQSLIDMGRISWMWRALAVCGFTVVLLSSSSALAQQPRTRLNGDIPEGAIVIHGDILVYPIYTAQAALGPCNDGTTTFAPRRSWPEGIVPFRFDSNVGGENRRLAMEAMDELIGASPDVVFLPRDEQEDYVHIRNADSNSSPVGRVGGEQILNMKDWDVKFTIVHELIHAAGFWHEQSRPDRDNFVTIVHGNIEEGKEHNFDRLSAGCWLSLQTEYDFGSVMHYSDSFFSTGGKTIVAKPDFEDFQDDMGQRERTSDDDREDLIDVYGEGRAFFVDHSANAATGNGTLADPFNTIQKATNALPADETFWTLWIRAGTYNDAGTFNLASTWRSYLGAVTVK